MLIHALNRQPDAVAIRDASGDMTYRELEHEISRVCQALASLGVRQGDRVGLLSANRVEVIFVNAALSIMGCCLVPMHPKGSLRDHRYFVTDAEIKTLIFDAEHYAERALQLQEDGLERLISLGNAAGANDLADLARGYAPHPLKAAVVSGGDLCRLSYSGGTTGEPKAIMGTYLSMLTKITIQLVEWEWPADIRQLICTPLSHAGGAMVLPTLIRGGSLVILPGWFVKSEYRVANYGSQTTNLIRVAPALAAFTSATYTLKPVVQTVSAELVYKFNWGR